MHASENPKTLENGISRPQLGVLFGAVLLLIVVVGYKAWDGGSEAKASGQDSAGPINIEQLRATADAAGDNALPWQQLGFAHFQRGEFLEAEAAYERSVALDGDEAVLWSALGEARVMASQREPLPPSALEAFNRAIELDPSDPRARYFLNVQKDLDGNHNSAIAGWLALLAETPQGAPWETDLIRTIEQVGAINGIDVEERIVIAQAVRGSTAVSDTPRGPTQAQIAAAGSIPPSEQRTMAEGMVGRLETRLAKNPSDVQGWIMLIRSRMTLDQPDLANEALQAALATNPASEARIREEAALLGVR